MKTKVCAARLKPLMVQCSAPALITAEALKTSGIMVDHYASPCHPGVFGMQKAQLHNNQEQAHDTGETEVPKILQILQ
jgi:hypothetical protein